MQTHLNVEVKNGSGASQTVWLYQAASRPQPWEFIAIEPKDIKPVVVGHTYVIKNVPSGNVLDLSGADRKVRVRSSIFTLRISTHTIFQSFNLSEHHTLRLTPKLISVVFATSCQERHRIS